MFKSFRAWLLPRLILPAKSPRRKTTRGNRFLPAFETLEVRQLLSAGASVVDNTLPSLVGDPTSSMLVVNLTVAGDLSTAVVVNATPADSTSVSSPAGTGQVDGTVRQPTLAANSTDAMAAALAVGSGTVTSMVPGAAAPATDNATTPTPPAVLNAPVAPAADVVSAADGPAKQADPAPVGDSPAATSPASSAGNVAAGGASGTNAQPAAPEVTSAGGLNGAKDDGVSAAPPADANAASAQQQQAAAPVDGAPAAAGNADPTGSAGTDTTSPFPKEDAKSAAGAQGNASSSSTLPYKGPQSVPGLAEAFSAAGIPAWLLQTSWGWQVGALVNQHLSLDQAIAQAGGVPTSAAQSSGSDSWSDSVAWYVSPIFSNPGVSLQTLGSETLHSLTNVGQGMVNMVAELGNIVIDLNQVQMQALSWIPYSLGLTNNMYQVPLQSHLFAGAEQAYNRGGWDAVANYDSEVMVNAMTFGLYGLQLSFGNAVQTGNWDQFQQDSGSFFMSVFLMDVMDGFGSAGASDTLPGLRPTGEPLGSFPAPDVEVPPLQAGPEGVPPLRPGVGPETVPNAQSPVPNSVVEAPTPQGPTPAPESVPGPATPEAGLQTGKPGVTGEPAPASPAGDPQPLPSTPETSAPTQPEGAGGTAAPQPTQGSESGPSTNPGETPPGPGTANQAGPSQTPTPEGSQPAEPPATQPAPDEPATQPATPTSEAPSQTGSGAQPSDGNPTSVETGGNTGSAGDTSTSSGSTPGAEPADPAPEGPIPGTEQESRVPTGTPAGEAPEPPAIPVTPPSPEIITGPDIVYRADTRPPDLIFSEGFRPRGGTATLEEYVYDNLPSNYVGTSAQAESAIPFAGEGGYLYVIESPAGGIDVATALELGPTYAEAETVFEGGIPSQNIMGAYHVGANDAPTGNFIPNPNYVPQSP